jgi:hypothetical protein
MGAIRQDVPATNIRYQECQRQKGLKPAICMQPWEETIENDGRRRISRWRYSQKVTHAQRCGLRNSISEPHLGEKRREKYRSSSGCPYGNQLTT